MDSSLAGPVDRGRPSPSRARSLESTSSNASGRRLQSVSRPLRRVVDDPRRAELAEVPAHERLGQPDVLDQLGHRGCAGRQALDDPQPVDVGQGLVEQSDLAELVGLVDDRCDGRADPGGRRAQGRLPGGRRARRLNADLYKSPLMLRPTSSRVNPVPRRESRPTPTARLHSAGEPWRIARPPGRARRRRVPGRPRADDHRRRPAVDHRGHGPPGGDRRARGWTQLRRASWIVNGYLLVYVATMPLAGRLADLWGARRLFLGALVGVHRRVVPGRSRPEPRHADRGAPRPGRRRRHPRPGRRRPPPPTCTAVTPDRGRSARSAP